MARLLTVLLLLIPLTGCIGCTWQANSASQAVTYTPGRGLSPANNWGYMNGEPMDARPK